MQLELSTGGIQWIVADVKLMALKFASVGSDGSPDCKKVTCNMQFIRIQSQYTCY